MVRKVSNVEAVDEAMRESCGKVTAATVQRRIHKKAIVFWVVCVLLVLLGLRCGDAELARQSLSP